MKWIDVVICGLLVLFLGMIYVSVQTTTEISSYQDTMVTVVKETLSQINTSTNGSDIVKIIERNCNIYINESFTAERNNLCKRDMIEKAFSGIGKR